MKYENIKMLCYYTIKLSNEPYKKENIERLSAVIADMLVGFNHDSFSEFLKRTLNFSSDNMPFLDLPFDKDNIFARRLLRLNQKIIEYFDEERYDLCQYSLSLMLVILENHK